MSWATPLIIKYLHRAYRSLAIGNRPEEWLYAAFHILNA